MYDRFYYRDCVKNAINAAVNNSATEYAWVLYEDVDLTDFDLRFVPNKYEQDFCHVWSSHNNPNSYTVWLIPVNVFRNNITPDIKHHTELLPSLGIGADVLAYYWETDPRIDYTDFNFDWLPDQTHWGKDQGFAMAGTQQLCYTYLRHRSATETVYHTSDLKFKKLAVLDEWQWETDSRIDYTNFNFDWLPDRWDIDKVHCWPMQGTEKLAYTKLKNLKYAAKEEKYHTSDLQFKDPIAKFTKEDLAELEILPEWYWVVDDRIDYTGFDFNWLPDEWEKHLEHCFSMAGTEQLSYTRLVNGMWTTGEEKFHQSSLTFKPGAATNEWVWVTDPRINYTDFNFNWLPDAWDISKEHCFAMRGCEKLNYTRLYNCKQNLTGKKYYKTELVFKPNAASNEWVWELDPRIDYSTFDLNWLPDEWDIDKDHWFTMKNCEELSYTRLYNKNQELKTKKYHKANLTFKADAAKDEWVWITDPRIDYTDFDFTWLPDKWDIDKAHCFAMAGTTELSYTKLQNIKHSLSENKFYTTDLKFKSIERVYWPENIDYADMLDWILAQNFTSEWVWLCDSRIDYTDFNFNWLPDNWDTDKIHCISLKNNQQLSYTWLINTNTVASKNFVYHKSNLKFKANQEKFIFWPNFVTTILSGFDWYDSLANWILEQDLSQEYVWVCDNRICYNNFDFDWLPEGWDREFIHCFTQKDKTQLSYTWLVNTRTLKNKKFKFHLADLEFDQAPYSTCLLDLGNNLETIKADRKIKFTGNIQDALRSAIRRCDTEYLWVASSISNYEKFKFDWLPDLDQITYTHCWPTPKQLKGETFLIHVPSFLRTYEFNFNFEHDHIDRYAWPAIVYKEDNLAEAVNSVRPTSLYTIYHKPESVIYNMPHPCIWEKRPVVSYNTCNSVSLVPRDCIVKEEIYEYPFLDRKTDCAQHSWLDIIFIHNKENQAIINLSHCSSNTPLDTTFKISSGVNGRLKAYQAAAEMSNTDWFLAIFAKCHVKESFKDFSWRPDYWQKPKHYIFHNHNVDLNLTYGHMAPIAYNKRLMLENTGGLDMTLVQEHAVVPLVLSETRLLDPWDTWRTAFRETIKLMYYAKTDNSIELQFRLNTWIKADCKNKWYKLGAQDAKDYFESVDGQWHWIMLTNEWDWLRQKFNLLYAADLTV